MKCQQCKADNATPYLVIGEYAGASNYWHYPFLLCNDCAKSSKYVSKLKHKLTEEQYKKLTEYKGY